MDLLKQSKNDNNMHILLNKLLLIFNLLMIITDANLFAKITYYYFYQTEDIFKLLFRLITVRKH